MRRISLAVGVAAVVVAIVGLANSATSQAGPPPPIFYYPRFSLTPPTAGRAFTAILIGHKSDVPWTLSCAVSLRGHAITAHRQDFGGNQSDSAFPGFDWRSCDLNVPPRMAGNALTLTVNASDSNGHTYHAARRWRIVRHAIMKPAPLGPYPPASFAEHFSDTRPVAGRAFTAIIVDLSDGGDWRLRCSASLRSHSIVTHRQEFGWLPDFRTCGFTVPQRSAAKMLAVTVDITAPNAQQLHITHAWRIVG
jgi:hypothetical protein